jgi:hypothetical protein
MAWASRSEWRSDVAFRTTKSAPRLPALNHGREPRNGYGHHAGATCCKGCPLGAATPTSRDGQRPPENPWTGADHSSITRATHATTWTRPARRPYSSSMTAATMNAQTTGLDQLGKKLNPDHPYQNPRVTVHINDGRAFLEQTRTTYDMILFALPDSLTLVAGQSSLRLESYLFTLQAVEAAKAHLNPGDGLFAMYNYYRTRWLRDRLANTLQVAFGHAPCSDYDAGTLSMLSITVNQSVMHCPTVWQRPANVRPPATDDHPFVYLDGNSIPSLYLVTLGLILLASVLLVRLVSGPYRRMAGYVDLFFMGAAFMLLETKNIVQFALLFGTTWFVNALVTAGVLVAVFAAVEVSRHVRVRRPALLYLCLLAALVVAWAVPPSALLGLSPVPRFLAAVAIAFAPIFLANMVFSQRFRDTADSTTAFGANLLGAMIGGVLEYLSLIVGYQWLLGLVALLYALAFIAGRVHLRAAGPALTRVPGTAGPVRSVTTKP